MSRAEPGESAIVAVRSDDERHQVLTVRSAAMAADIPVEVQLAADRSVPRPVLYMLLGAAGGVDGATWASKTDAWQFLSDKNVNVVTPIGGMFSYYTDWVRDDPRLGRNKWRTFLTQELPPLLDRHLNANGRNGILGYSMSGTSTLALAATTPNLYQAVAAYSGCAQTSDPLGHEFVRLTVEEWGLANVQNMWGPPDDPNWVRNDPYVQAEGLRGKAIYISNGSGLPGAYDVYGGKHSLPGAWGYANQLVVGGVIEAGTDYCARNMRKRLDDLGIAATYNLRPTGTHSWGYWEEDLKDSWPVLAAGLGV
ncbi:esterase family protein [Nocardia sp. CDC159]|uniref:Esterase family protein n=2 Tax=Nocardiaceae TaxID=85025 RepID=A0A9X2IYS4_9NOCA|nr:MULTISPECIES: alpha/beta hydrolase family protein [Nocardia]MCM6775989.1 esterase family protein [Nocardia pulmonis]MCM6788684.1 esterase family protein [Nocardia sp. CDC159]